MAEKAKNSTKAPKSYSAEKLAAIESVEQPDTPVMVNVDHVTKQFRLKKTISLKDEFVRFLLRRPVPDRGMFTALDNVNFTINKGESVGLVGLNGSGKSTLLKCISGVQKVDGGHIETRGHVAGLLEVGAGFSNDLTGRENVYLNGAILGMTKEQIDNAFDDIVKFSEIEKFLDTEVRFYSSGMYMRLAFSVAVHSNPDVFLVDEVLAVGDEPFRRKCAKKIHELKEQGKTLVIVSHSTDQVLQFCDRAILLSHGKMMADGNTEQVLSVMLGREVKK
ncbi:MAG: ABC transporter ATP-binding protein [Bifidobacteriaceae bacterium]|jgi:ABC-2 type transport system ATP-binding protein|nr:ABC transporter ATP-binding protein [Bifidobacteriaceae bacterium]MCI1979429.1 ABC transporter ATP-binding protein [Bifidobacteriaceae bacterium]